MAKERREERKRKIECNPVDLLMLFRGGGSERERRKKEENCKQRWKTEKCGISSWKKEAKRENESKLDCNSQQGNEQQASLQWAGFRLTSEQ